MNNLAPVSDLKLWINQLILSFGFLENEEWLVTVRAAGNLDAFLVVGVNLKSITSCFVTDDDTK